MLCYMKLILISILEFHTLGTFTFCIYSYTSIKYMYNHTYRLYNFFWNFGSETFRFIVESIKGGPYSILEVS